METAVILGENQVFSPYLATALPYFIFSAIWILVFYKKTSV